MTTYTVEQAARDGEWLLAVGALRAFVRGPGIVPAFVVTTHDRREHVFTVAEIRALRVGVLTGWRLPRADGALG